MDGRRLHGRRQGRRLVGEDVRVESRDRQSTAQAGFRGSSYGVGQRGCQRGLAEAHATAGIRRVATSVGRRANVFLDRAEQEDELRDYERLTATSKSFIYVAMTRVMVGRLARAQ